MKSLKYVGVCIGAALLCGSMQAATLKEIEAQKKAEQAKMEAEQKARQFGKYQVLLVNWEKEDVSILTELSDEIPQAKKDMYMKAVREANMRIAKYEYSKNEIGHMIERNMHMTPGVDCELMTKYDPHPEYPQQKQKELRLVSEQAASVFVGKYGFVDLCTIGIVKHISETYQNVYDNKGHYSYNPAALAEKQSFAKWLKDVKFYEYVESLEINNQNKVESLQWDINRIKKNMMTTIQ